MLRLFKYKKDDCVQAVFDKVAIERYGCTTPFGPNKEMICTNKTVGKEVRAMYEDWFKRDGGVHNCTTPCRIIMTKAIKTRQKSEETSVMKFYFSDRVKLVKSYHLYSGLALVAEIGGYVGLFLGVSLNQITKVMILLKSQWIQKY